MADVGDLTLEAVRDFMLLNGGKVTNHDLVKHFKGALTNPETRVQARNEFKEIVNTVATIVRSDEGEKYLLLKKKYRTPSLQGVDTPASTPDLNSSLSMTSLYSLGDKRPMALSVSQDSLDSATSPTRQPPPYRPPPPPTPTPPPAQSSAPPVPPRKKSTGSNKENSPEISRPTTIGAEADVNESDPENKISVKEGIQKFQRMASESALQKAHLPAFKKSKTGLDKDEDTHSVTSLDPKAREWMVKAAQADYQALFKLASENPKLAKFKTALHWAAKHGNVDVIKLIAGTHKADVNVRTGYTACHIAMQYGHEEIFNVLKDVYGADTKLRDWSGRKPHQYLTNKDTVSADTFRKIKARKKQAEKDSGFLRIGSLNVRVKKTTEAFSNFLGVGNADKLQEKLHKNWGSADNIPQGDTRKMPPPKYAPIKKRKSKRAIDYVPPSRPESVISTRSAGNESDSDTAAGFGTNWQATV